MKYQQHKNPAHRSGSDVEEIQMHQPRNDEFRLSPTASDHNPNDLHNRHTPSNFTLDSTNNNKETPGMAKPTSSDQRRGSQVRKERENKNNNDNNNENANNNNNNNASSAKKLPASKYRPSLRFIIALICGTIVTMVAIVCIVTSHIVTTATVRDLGLSLSRSLINSAAIKAQDYFEAPVQLQQAIRRAIAGSNMKLPTDDPAALPTDFCMLTRPGLIASNFSIPVVGVQLEDGGLYMSYSTYDFAGKFHFAVCGIRTPTPNRSFSTNRVEMYYMDTNDSRIPPNLEPTTYFTENTQGDSRASGYAQMKPLVASPTFLGKTIFGPSIAFPTTDQGASLQVGFVTSLQNMSGTFLGVIAMSMPSEALTDFFRSLSKTPHSEIIAIDGSAQVLASTIHGIAIYNSWFQPLARRVPTNCLTTAQVLETANPGIICPKVANAVPGANNTYPYPPLNFVAALYGKTILSPQGEILVEEKIDGTNYFIMATPVRNSGALFYLTILFFLPQDDLFGDIQKGQTTVIIVACVIFFFAILISMFLIVVILKPINTILLLMTEASQLRLTPVEAGALDEDNLSKIQEIADLQRTFGSMQVAFSSFQKYVSTDLLADILASGELAKLGLYPQQCTLIFSDIVSFTSICERISPENLSLCLTVYFERMTTIISETGGVANNFIGDAIFTVFGAPSLVLNQEIKACACALLSLRETVVDPIRHVWDDAGEIISIRQGIHVGTPNVGNIGSNSRCIYTCLGPEVNLAARFEGANKQFGTKIMVSNDIALKVSSIFLLRLLMPVAVVGMEEAVKVYELVGVRPNLSLDGMMEKDEEIQSMSLASRVPTPSQTAVSHPSDDDAAPGKVATELTMTNHHLHQKQGRRTAHVSRRKNAQLTAKSIVEAAIRKDRINNASIVTTPIEETFVNAFNTAANYFCDGHPDACLDAVRNLRTNFPAFFEDSTGCNIGDVIKLVGKERCQASLIRAEISAGKLEKLCRMAKEAIANDNNKNKDYSSYFVFRAEEK